MHEAQPAAGIPSQPHLARAGGAASVRIRVVDRSVPSPRAPAAMETHEPCVVPVHARAGVVDTPGSGAIVGVAVPLHEIEVAPPLDPALVAHLVAPGHAHVVPPVAGGAAATASPGRERRAT